LVRFLSLYLAKQILDTFLCQLKQIQLFNLNFTDLTNIFPQPFWKFQVNQYCQDSNCKSLWQYIRIFIKHLMGYYSDWAQWFLLAQRKQVNSQLNKLEFSFIYLLIFKFEWKLTNNNQNRRRIYSMRLYLMITLKILFHLDFSNKFYRQKANRMKIRKSQLKVSVK